MAGLINFEDEQEVKQFLDNLGVEYSFQCHREKDPEGRRSCPSIVGAELLSLSHTHTAASPVHLLFNRVSEAGGLPGGCEEEL